ncbi:hypothetical protein [Nocardia lasii]|uniref:Immunity protein 63 domain-containing protein n=1 Tax=Nocardia lasii TaxID=1616107 RepID=A0ABW1JPQ9_9NOCA
MAEFDYQGELSVMGSRLVDRIGNRSVQQRGEFVPTYSWTHSWLTGQFDPYSRYSYDSEALAVLVGFGADYLTVTLETYIDVWMPFDLRGRSQAEIFAYNAPRLTSVLRQISDAIGTEIDPCERSKLARATETGVENYFDETGMAEDVWCRYFG